MASVGIIYFAVWPALLQEFTVRLVTMFPYVAVWSLDMFSVFSGGYFAARPALYRNYGKGQYHVCPVWASVYVPE